MEGMGRGMKEGQDGGPLGLADCTDTVCTIRYSGEMPDTVWRKWRHETADSVCEIRTATRVRSSKTRS